MLENGSEECSCKKLKCVRHGKCDECIAYHKNKDQLPRCKRPKENIFNFLKRK